MNFEEQKDIYRNLEDDTEAKKLMVQILMIAERIGDYYVYNLASEENGYLTEETSEEYAIFSDLPLDYFALRNQRMSEFYSYFRGQILFHPTTYNEEYAATLKNLEALKDFYQSTQP